jgi:hypothetical protein
MTSQLTGLSPVQQAEQALQVDRVLARMDQRFTDEAWARGVRFGPGGGNCLIGAIDEATSWTMPGVAEEVAYRLGRELPRPFRRLAGRSPRLALVLYNDTIGGAHGAHELVRAARRSLCDPGPAPSSAPVGTRGRQELSAAS